jgi:peptidylprolyl isomerase
LKLAPGEDEEGHKPKPNLKDEPENPYMHLHDRPGDMQVIITTPLGLIEKTILKANVAGRKPIRGQTVKIDCTIFLEAANKQVWSTKDKYSKPYSFVAGVGNVVKGWDEAVMTMRQGEKARFNITGTFGYGLKGFPAFNIPSNANLIIEQKILEIGEEITLPSVEDLIKKNIANKHVFIQKDKDETGAHLRFNSAPF